MLRTVNRLLAVVVVSAVFVALTPGVGSAATPGLPGSLATTASNKSVILTWTLAANTPTDYIIEYSSDQFTSLTTTFLDGTSTNLTATVTGLTNGTAYTFTVTATNAAGTSASSEPSPWVRTKLTTPSAAPSLSGWGLVALTAGMLAVMAVALQLTSGSRPAARP